MRLFVTDDGGRIRELLSSDVVPAGDILILDNGEPAIVSSEDDKESLMVALERRQWIPVATATDPINPQHYQNYLKDMQWIEAMAHIVKPIEPGLELMVRKYLDRRGKKDEELQELKKALWYLKYWIAVIENKGQPVDPKDIV